MTAQQLPRSTGQHFSLITEGSIQHHGVKSQTNKTVQQLIKTGDAEVGHGFLLTSNKSKVFAWLVHFDVWGLFRDSDDLKHREQS